MCHYIDHSVYYSKRRAQPRHIQGNRKWDECRMAKENGHYCPDASPAKDLGGNVILIGSSKKPGESPQGPPRIAKVSCGRLWLRKLLTRVIEVTSSVVPSLPMESRKPQLGGHG